tara:strand:+ start:148 stop:915 length:768 start_codon:yes stop_codon:yes gene_type:complete
MPALCVNIDHVATVRQARRTWEPDPVKAAEEACRGGADGITIHLREDRRHIQDADLEQLAGTLPVPLNLEMAATGEMVDIALRTKPDMAMLVPEGRQEVTTEGGLDVVGRFDELKQVLEALQGGGIRVSAFIDAEDEQVDAAQACGFDVCEIHTGPYAHAFHAEGGGFEHPVVQAELDRVSRAGERIHGHGMCFNAGHGLTIWNVGAIAALPRLHELHIGHSIISRSIFTGLRTAVADIKKVITEAANQGATLDA